jgi:hypothetical protein
VIICPEYGFPYLLDNVSGPVVPKFSWFYDVIQNDLGLKGKCVKFLHGLKSDQK